MDGSKDGSTCITDGDVGGEGFYDGLVMIIAVVIVVVMMMRLQCCDGCVVVIMVNR